MQGCCVLGKAMDALRVLRDVSRCARDRAKTLRAVRGAGGACWGGELAPLAAGFHSCCNGAAGGRGART